MRNCHRYRIIEALAVFILLGWVQLSIAEPIRPRDPDSIFYQAACYYKTAQYEKAISDYHLLLEQGLESGPLYYNLGNCYFMKGELGRAVLNYERAKRIMPSDGDLEANYTLAISLIKGSPHGEAKSWPEKILFKLFNGLSVNALTLLLSLISVLILFFIALRIYFKGIRKRLSIAIVGLMVLFFLASFSLYEKGSSIGREAVAITERIEVRLEPFDRASLHFILYEGMKVRVLHSKGDWVKIRAFNQKAGWIKASGIEGI